MNQQTLLDVDPHVRREDDFYSTPPYQTRALLRRLNFCKGLRVFEPCCGDGAIVRELPEHCEIVTNDVVARDPMLPDFLMDARAVASWQAFSAAGPFDVVITNPPFNEAFEIAEHAYDADIEALILLLRLSWLEPTEERGSWLACHPPTQLIVLPRHDYRGNGKTDSVTSAWVIWRKSRAWQSVPVFDFVTKAERDELIAAERLAR